MNNEVEEMTETEANESFFETPIIEVPPSVPQAHRAVITAVNLKTIATRDDAPVIEVAIVSRDIATLEDKIGIFIPKAYAENIALGSKFDVSSLSEGADFWSQMQTMFRRNVANSDKTATLQKLVFNPDSVARKAERDPVELGLNPRPKTLEEYVENISKMLVGVECIVKFRERGGDDPAFQHQLQAKEILPATDYETNSKAYKKYQIAWLS